MRQSFQITLIAGEQPSLIALKPFEFMHYCLSATLIDKRRALQVKRQEVLHSIKTYKQKYLYINTLFYSTVP